MSVDAITIELVRNRLVAGAQQMAAVLWKSAYSTVIREVLDYSTAIFDRSGHMVAQSAQLPFQMMTMSAPLRFLIEQEYPWEPGDVVLLNDPYLARAQHLPDFILFSPVYVDGRRVAFVGAIAHMIDTGGGAAGSYLADATEIYQEGLRIPPIKIRQYEGLRQDILDFIAANVREPEKTLGDLRAMTASLGIGADVVREVVVKYGVSQIEAAMTAVLDASESLMRTRLSEMEDGTYIAVDYVDDDGINETPIKISVEISVLGDRAVVDLSGSSPQVSGPVNATYAMTETTVNYVLMAALAPGMSMNDGCKRPISVVASPRTVVNAESPAPVASRVTTCHRIVDAMLQALAQVIPDHVMAGYYGVSNICNLGGNDPKTHKKWVHFEIEVGGWGARPTSDGLDAFSAHIHNLANTPIEVVESSLPLRVERYQFRPDSGGRGMYRGGLGLCRDIRVLQEGVRLNLLSDRSKFPPPGMLGGESGKSGGYTLNPDSPDAEVLPDKLSNFTLKKGDVVRMETQGGGGYGPPQQRAPELIVRDRGQGKVTDPEPNEMGERRVRLEG